MWCSNARIVIGPDLPKEAVLFTRSLLLPLSRGRIPLACPHRLSALSERSTKNWLVRRQQMERLNNGDYLFKTAGKSATWLHFRWYLIIRGTTKEREASSMKVCYITGNTILDPRLVIYLQAFNHSVCRLNVPTTNYFTIKWKWNRPSVFAM